MAYSNMKALGIKPLRKGPYADTLRVRRMNITLNEIAHDTRRLNMGTYVAQLYPNSIESVPACGTLGCFAGWYVMSNFTRHLIGNASTDFLHGESIKAIPPVLLGEVEERDHVIISMGTLTAVDLSVGAGHPHMDELSVRNLLFYVTGWPRQFGRVYEKAGHEERVHVLRDRLHHFIQTGT